jgi:hypothetical protein
MTFIHIAPQNEGKRYILEIGTNSTMEKKFWEKLIAYFLFATY